MYLHEISWNQKNHSYLPPIVFPPKSPRLLSAMKIYLQKRNLDFELALKHGWYPGFYRGPRIIVPCFRTDGLFWQGRLLDDIILPGDENLKRWDSPQGSRGDALAVFDRIGDGKVWIIVEGPCDALAAAGVGFSSIATLGAAPSIAVLKHIRELTKNAERAIIVPDRDATSQWLRLQRLLGIMGLWGEIQEPPFPYKDLAMMPKQEREKFLL